MDEKKPEKPPKPPKGEVTGLAKAWADDEYCRKQILAKGTLLRWPDSRTTGVISQRSLKLNKPVMLAVARILCPQHQYPLGLYIHPCKAEASHVETYGSHGSLSLPARPCKARQIRRDLMMEPDPSNVHCEGHAVKAFQTLINKRMFASVKKRATWLLWEVSGIIMHACMVMSSCVVVLMSLRGS